MRGVGDAAGGVDGKAMERGPYVKSLSYPHPRLHIPSQRQTGKIERRWHSSSKFKFVSH